MSGICTLPNKFYFRITEREISKKMYTLSQKKLMRKKVEKVAFEEKFKFFYQFKNSSELLFLSKTC